MSFDSIPSPYVGLRPFREPDHAFFFGRERDTRIIATNLRGQRLTVLYGASGVGKSSVLQAGVVPLLKLLTNSAVVYFNRWQNPSFLEELHALCREAFESRETGELDDIARGAGRQAFLLLDQFEEFLLYHVNDTAGDRFEKALARIINSESLGTHVLIGIREDALSRFDHRFSVRIANLLTNTLPIDHLSLNDARAAIEKPIGVLNSAWQTSFQMEPGLVEELLRQVQSGVVSVGEVAGLGSVAGGPAARIETPFLQLVLKRLWDEERQRNSSILRLTTLADIGGAGRIVQVHVDEVMQRLDSEPDRAIAARMFRYLVTPSRTKIAQNKADLVSFAEDTELAVDRVLKALTDRPDSRILRRLSSPERYEIFHDVLAQPILDWGRKFSDAVERAEQEQATRAEMARQQRELEQTQRFLEAQARAARRLRWMAGILVILAAAALLFANRAMVQQERAKLQQERADALAVSADGLRARAETAASEANAARNLAQATLADLQAARAREEGHATEAARLAADAHKYRAEALTLQQKAADQRQSQVQSAAQLVSAVESRERRLSEALREADDLKRRLNETERQLAAAQTERDKPKTSKPEPGAEQPRAFNLEVLLDRVRVYHDSTAGGTQWAFDVFVNNESILSIPGREYRDGQDYPITARKTKVVNGSTARLRVVGTRLKESTKLAVEGQTVLRLDGDAQEVLTHVEAKTRDPFDGEFLFFFKISTTR